MTSVIQTKNNTTSSGTSLGVTFDSTPTEGNLLVIIGSYGYTTAGWSGGYPDGWTEVAGFGFATNEAFPVFAFAKFAGASDAGPHTFTADSATSIRLRGYELVGNFPALIANVVSDESVSGLVSTGLTCELPTISVTIGELCIAYVHTRLAQTLESINNDFSSGELALSHYATKTSTAASESVTFTYVSPNPSNQRRRGMLFAISETVSTSIPIFMHHYANH